MEKDDLISRAAAIQIAERYGCNNGSALGHHSGAADCVASEIATLPAVDAVPVAWMEAQDNIAVKVTLAIWQKEQEAMA